MQVREKDLDALKGFAIFLVVVGHICVKSEALVQWIYSFHMPLFWIISGYFLYKGGCTDSIITFIRKKIKTILWPYYVWGLLSCCATALVAINSDNMNLFFKTILSRVFGYVISENTIGAVWFLMVLFEAEVAYYTLEKLHMNWIGVVIWSISFILYMRGVKINLPFLLQLFWFGIGFVYIGSIIAKYSLVEKAIIFIEKIENSFIQVLVFLFSIVISSTILTYGTFINGVVAIYSGNVGNAVLFWLVAIGWSFFWLFLFKMYGQKFRFFFLDKIGRESLLIMVTHFYVNSFVTTFLHLERGNLIMLIWSGILTVICYFLAIFIRKYMRFLIYMPNLKFRVKEEV